MKLSPLRILLVLLATTLPAAAHTGHGDADGFTAGFLHPFTGIDHLLAMLAVGLWAAIRGGGAIWVWPVTFVAAMLTGFGLAMQGAVLPFYEPMILASLIGLGLVIALAVPMPVWGGAALIALFGLFHGYAHGVEVSGAVLAFATGFALASMLLHVAGIAIAFLTARVASMRPVRVAGAAIAIFGLALAIMEFTA